MVADEAVIEQAEVITKDYVVIVSAHPDTRCTAEVIAAD